MVDDLSSPFTAESGSFRIIDSLRPKAGTDYPRSAAELEARFGSEAECASLVERLRFPRGFVCPSCDCRRTPWRSGTGLLACPDCRAPVAVTERALFHGSRIPLTAWFRATWQWLESPSLIDDTDLATWLAIDAPRAASYLAQLRSILPLDDERPLRGEVLIAKASLPSGPSMLLGAEQGSAARIRLRRLRRGNAGEVLRFAAETVAAGSLVVTPPWKGLKALRAMGFHHKYRTSHHQLHGGTNAQDVWAAVRDWLGDAPLPETIFQGAVDELVYRFNRRDQELGLRWHRVMALSVSHPRRLSAALRGVGS